MKKVKMLVSMAGPDESWQPGDERDVEDGVAEEWKQLGIATIMPDGDAVVFEAVSREDREAAYRGRLDRMKNKELKLHARARFDKAITGNKAALVKQIIAMDKAA
jgi:hypothetical protein